MSRIIIFGDSFATKWPDDYVWTNQLAKKFDAEQVNYASGGSSIEYSLYQLKDYLQNNYNKKDIIIFIATNPSRSPIIHPEYDPKWACFYKENPNNEYYKTVVRYTDVNIDKYKYWIVATILNGISNDAFLMCAFDHCEEQSTRENFIISKFSLREVSASNYPVANHLAKENHTVMAELVYQSIINKNDLFDQKHFVKTTAPTDISKDFWSRWLSPTKN